MRYSTAGEAANHNKLCETCKKPKLAVMQIHCQEKTSYELEKCDRQDCRFHCCCVE